jgi:hypothetical protein
MFELAPILAGVLLGVAAPRTLTAAHRRVLLSGSLVIGSLASFLSHEISESWLFLPFDSGLVLFSAIATRQLREMRQAQIQRNKPAGTTP